MTGLGGGGICAGQEIEQQRVGFRGDKEGIVKQDEFPKFRLEIAGRYWPIAEACRFGIGIRVKDSLRESVVAGPEPGAAYFVTESGSPGTPPGWSGARRPEKRVTARSKPPQKKWTGLTLPRKLLRKSLNTRSAWTSARQK